jgi:hypothetical protein
LKTYIIFYVFLKRNQNQNLKAVRQEKEEELKGEKLIKNEEQTGENK